MVGTLEVAKPTQALPDNPASALGASGSSRPAAGFEVERPKEHGAYAMLGVPLVTSLVMAGFTWVGVCVAVASVCGFVAHEPIMISTGRRGPRALRQSPHAHKRALLLVTVAIVLGAIAFVLSPLTTRYALVACLVGASISFTMSALGQHRSLLAQLLSSVGLVLPSLVVLFAGEVELVRSLELTAAWIVGQSAALVAVRSVIACQKKSAIAGVPWINDALQVLLTMIALADAMLGSGVGLCILPMTVMAMILRLYPPQLRQLRRVGWSLVIANILSALTMLVAF